MTPKRLSYLLAAATLCSTAAVEAQTLTNSLIFYAPFSGSLNDVTGGRTGVGTNGPSVQTTGGVGGGGCLRLQNNGMDPKQAVYYDDPTPATADFSFQIWVRSADPQNGQNDGDGAFASNKDWDSGGNVGWVIARQTGAEGDQFQWNMNTVGGTRKDYDPRNPVAMVFDGNWHQIVITYSRSGDALFYRDGAAIGTVSISANNNQSIRPALNNWITSNILALGEDATLNYDHGSGTAYNGDLDEAAMWDRVLTAEEVAAAYYKGINGKALSDPVPPFIVEQPRGGTRYASDNFVLSCLVAGDGGSLGYQWYKEASPVAGATSREVVLSNLTAGVANYRAVITDASGSITSAPAALTVLSSSQITNGIALYLPFDNNLTSQAGMTLTGNPIGAVAAPRYVGGQVSAAVDFENDGNDGAPSDWAVSLGDIESIYTNNWSFSLWINTTNTSDGANFGNKDWNSGGNVGWLLAANRPNINGSLNYTCAGGTRHDIGGADIHDGAWHHVVAVFNRDLNTTFYYVDGGLRSSAGIGATGWQSLDPNLEPKDTLVGSSGNGRWSGAATIDDLGMWNRTLTPDEILAIFAEGSKGNPLTKAVAGSAVKPSISTQPQSLTQLQGYPAAFSVTASGTKPLAYQWKKDGQVLNGATNATLDLPPVSAADAGAYLVVVANQFGSVTSSPAILQVVPLAGQITTGLTVYLNFDNNINGQSGTTINGTPIGEVGIAKYTNSIIGTAAAQFNNDNSDDSRASDWAISLGDIEWIYTNNWSFSIWLKTTDTYGSLLGNKNWYSGANIGWCISRYYMDWLNYRAEGAPRHDIGSFNWADDRWHQVGAVFYRDGNRVYTFVDGVITAQAPLGTTGYESLSPSDIMATLIGSSGGTADSGFGAVDDLGIWTRTISAIDMMNIYQSGKLGIPLPAAAAQVTQPTISIRATPTGVALIYPASAANMTVESSPNLSAGSWTKVNVTPQIVGDTALVTIPYGGSVEFFRLKQ